MNRIIDLLLLAEPFRPFWVDMSDGTSFHVEKAIDLEIVNEDVLFFHGTRYLHRLQITGLDLEHRRPLQDVLLEEFRNRE